MTKLGFSFTRSVGFRLFLAMTGIVAVISIYIYMYFPGKLRDNATEAVRSKGKTMSEFIAFSVNPALVFEDKEMADETMKAAEQNPSILYLVITDSKGEIFSSHNLELAKHVNFSDEGNVDQVHYSDSVYMDRTPIMHSGKTVGTLYTGHSLRQVLKEMQKSRLVVFVISIAIFFVSAILAWWISLRFSSPLRRMGRMMQKVGAGDLSQKLKVNRNDEIGVLGYEFDQMVTKLDQSTREITNREALYRNLVESMNEGLVEFSDDLTILFANSRFCEMFGRTQAEVKGKTIDEVTGMKPEDKEKLRDAFSHNINEKGQLEMQLLGRNSKKIWGLVSLAPDLIKSEFGGMNAIFANITSLKATESELLYRNRELDTFVYKASHDLKAPLSSIQGLVNVARLESADPPALLYLSLIERTATKMDDVLHGLLEVGWIRQEAFQYTSVDIGQQVETIYQTIQHTPGFAEIKFERDIPVNCIIDSDFKLLYSVLQNIIQNAFKYHRESGEDRFVKIEVQHKNGMVLIHTIDNGPGIPDNAQPRVFDMFYRATNRSQGSGLGLYIVKTAVEKLGGYISLFSKEGSGTTFTLELPEKAETN